jgi:uncharacterized protein (DUF488 family)
MTTSERAPDANGAAQPAAPTVFTIGHSTQSVDAFIALLTHNGASLVADVRRFPASRRHPQFSREALVTALAAAGIAYEWLPELGGRRAARADSRNTGWRNDGFRGYADYMETQAFQLGAARLIDLAQRRPTAYMCAEHAWQQCHRGLISDYLKVAGWQVLHILARGKTEPHPFTEPARVVDGSLTYAGQGELDLPTR